MFARFRALYHHDVKIDIDRLDHPQSAKLGHRLPYR